jgi:hypothetical protein
LIGFNLRITAAKPATKVHENPKAYVVPALAGSPRRQQDPLTVAKMRFACLLAIFLAACAEKRDWDLVSRKDVRSPDGRFTASVFEMTGYNTTGYEPQLSILKQNERIGDYGNVLRGRPGEKFTVHWLNSSNLVVEYGTDYSFVSIPPETNHSGIKILINRVPLN